MASTQTALVRIPTASTAPIQRRRSGGRRSRKKGGVSPAAIKDRQQTRTLCLGGLSSVAFGLLQRNMNLPSLENVPDTLLYGAIGTLGGVLLKSPTLVQCASGPLFAGLHRIGARGFQPAPAGEEQLQGEFDEVVSGDFDDL